MISPSPEFPITKLGMHPHHRKRDKPIRTYGSKRHTAPTPDTTGSSDCEPPAKKRKSTHEDLKETTSEDAGGRTKRSMSRALQPAVISTPNSQSQEKATETAQDQANNVARN
ncbi:hypothetical protein ACO1O0_007571 [Amphichorda felina]